MVSGMSFFHKWRTIKQWKVLGKAILINMLPPKPSLVTDQYLSESEYYQLEKFAL